MTKNSNSPYNGAASDRIANVLKDVKNVTRDNNLSKFDAAFFRFYGPAFKSMTDIFHKYNEIPKSHKVSYLWFDDGELGAVPYFLIKAYDSNYKEIEICSRDMRKAEAKEIVNVLEQMVFEIRKEIEEIQKLPKIEELDDTFLAYINKYINSKEYKVSIESGELVEEIAGDYKAFVIRFKNTNAYKCSFRFRTDRIGNIMAIYESPYYGNYYGNARQSEIEEHIKDMVKKFHID